MREISCELERRTDDELQAYYHCEHGLLPFGDATEDCACHARLYRRRAADESGGGLNGDALAQDARADFDGALAFDEPPRSPR